MRSWIVNLVATRDVNPKTYIEHRYAQRGDHLKCTGPRYAQRAPPDFLSPNWSRPPFEFGSSLAAVDSRETNSRLGARCSNTAAASFETSNARASWGNSTAKGKPEFPHPGSAPPSCTRPFRESLEGDFLDGPRRPRGNDKESVASPCFAWGKSYAIGYIRARNQPSRAGVCRRTIGQRTGEGAVPR
jgi:hypothetical protein